MDEEPACFVGVVEVGDGSSSMISMISEDDAATTAVEDGGLTLPETSIPSARACCRNGDSSAENSRSAAANDEGGTALRSAAALRSRVSVRDAASALLGACVPHEAE